MLIILAMGVGHRLTVKAAKKRDQDPPDGISTLATVHRWAGRIVWVLLLINTGL
jgi:hypothetical protein